MGQRLNRTGAIEYHRQTLYRGLSRNDPKLKQKLTNYLKVSTKVSIKGRHRKTAQQEGVHLSLLLRTQVNHLEMHTIIRAPGVKRGGPAW